MTTITGANSYDYIGQVYLNDLPYSAYSECETPLEALDTYLSMLRAERKEGLRLDPVDAEYLLESIEAATIAKWILSQPHYLSNLAGAIEEMRRGSKELSEIADTMESGDYSALEF